MLYAAFKTYFASPECNVEVPPDRCLRHSNGLVEQDNGGFDILVLWIPAWGRILQSMANRMHDDLEGIINGALTDCVYMMPRIYEVEESHIDDLHQCFREKVREHTRWSYRSMAILPGDGTGHYVSFACYEGHIMVEQMFGLGMVFSMTIVIQPY